MQEFRQRNPCTTLANDTVFVKNAIMSASRKLHREFCRVLSRASIAVLDIEREMRPAFPRRFQLLLLKRLRSKRSMRTKSRRRIVQSECG
jgi:hypothetical protein